MAVLSVDSPVIYLSPNVAEWICDDRSLRDESTFSLLDWIWGNSNEHASNIDYRDKNSVLWGGKILFQCDACDIFRTSILSLFGCTNPFLKHAQNIKESLYVSIT